MSTTTLWTCRVVVTCSFYCSFCVASEVFPLVTATDFVVVLMSVMSTNQETAIIRKLCDVECRVIDNVTIACAV